MNTRILRLGITRLAIAPLLVAALCGVTAQGAQGQDRDHDDHHDNGNRGNKQGRGNSDHDNRGDDRDHDKHEDQDFRFRDQDRNNFQSHYSRDVDRWRQRPQGRPQFQRGQRIPSNYYFHPVPRAYYSNVPPPPVGYQYGYNDGYVVAYNPMTRIIADVLDLVVTASR